MMEIKVLNASEIDKKSWNTLIKLSTEGNFYALYEILETSDRDWKAIVVIRDNAYLWAFPFQVKKKFLIPYIDQDPLIIELGSFKREGEIIDYDTQKSIRKLFDKYNIINNYRFNTSNTKLDLITEEGFTHVLNLKGKTYQDLYSSFNTNRKREIKKAKKLSLEVNEKIDIDEYLSLFKKYTAPKIIGFEDFQIDSMKKLLEKLDKLNLLEQYSIFKNKTLLSSCIIIKYKGKLTYYFSSNAIQSKNTGSSTLIIDHIIKKYQNQPFIFDFEGSDEPSIARFYKSFGSYSIPIQKYNKNELPFFLSYIRQLKNRFF